MRISSKEYTDNQVHWLEKVTNAEIKAIRQAVEKVETTNAAKFEQQNEWRGTIKDNQAANVTRRELWAAVIAIIAIVLGIMAYLK